MECRLRRAIHLELTSSLLNQEFKKSFEKLTAERGKPREISSDNAKIFDAVANSELEEVLLDVEITLKKRSLTYVIDEFQYPTLTNKTVLLGTETATLEECLD